MSNEFESESRAASKAALGLPSDHPGYVPASNEVWKAHVNCASCGRKLTLHMPSDDERAEQNVVGAHANDPVAGPLCSYACLYRHQPDHPISKGLHPDSIARDLKMLDIEEKKREIAALLESLS